MQDLQQTKDQLFSIIAHDLRTPFNALVGFSKQLKTDVSNKKLSSINTSLTSIEQSSNNAYFLFEDLLGWTKSQTGQLNFNPQNLALDQNIQESLGILEGMIQFKNINVQIDLEENWVTADKYMLNTIFRNLLTNGLKFLKQDGKLKVISKNQGEFIRIEIQDNGVGMDKETLETILEYKEDRRKGLGMVLCKQFVAKIGGDIGIESTLGQGTMAWFTIPKAETPADYTQMASTKNHSNKSFDLTLDQKTKEALIPILTELKKLEVFQLSEIYQLLDGIDTSNNSNLEKWSTALRQSATNVDEAAYQKILEIAQL